MVFPYYSLTANRFDASPDAPAPTHQQGAGWVVAFVHYNEPASSYTDDSQYAAKSGSSFSNFSLVVVDSDCTEVSVSNPKTDYSKRCSMTIQEGTTYWPGAVSAGDWVFVWIKGYDSDLDHVRSALATLRATPSTTQDLQLCDWKSGFKFFGRVESVSHTDAVTQGGRRTFAAQVEATSFRELSSSVYYTNTAQFIYSTIAPGPNGSLTLAQIGLKTALGDLAAKFVQFFTNSSLTTPAYPQPDVAVLFYYVIALGVQNQTNTIFPDNPIAVGGTYNDAIRVPQLVAKILNRPSARFWWELVSANVGLQSYSNQGNTPWQNFSPLGDYFPSDQNPVFLKSQYRCKGWVPYYPVAWNNRSLWDIFGEYLNPALNEMYTSLRIDRFGNIRPTFTVREIPLGTNLFDALQLQSIADVKRVQEGNDPRQPASQFSQAARLSRQAAQTDLQQARQKAQNQAKQFEISNPSLSHPDEEIRAMYGNLPRWGIDRSIVDSVSMSTSEGSRVNFVQVWGRNAMNNLTPPDSSDASPGAVPQQSSIQQDIGLQLVLGNMVADNADIQRNGLRANVVEIPFDYPAPTNSRSGFWARMRADWLFNGHLKASATARLWGIDEPICEGDNAELDGMLFHIEQVDHVGSIDQNGTKTFRTMLRLSHGMVASSIDGSFLPSYLCHLSPLSDDQPGAPGVTNVPDGERS